MAKTSAFRPEKRRWTDKAKLASERLWAERPEIVKQFIDQRPDYEKLCSEVAYTLNRKLVKAGVDFSNISYRAKTLDSFLEKVQRKSYQDPISEITDFAGVRVVYLYADDLARLEAVVGENFEVVEKVDKLNKKRDDRFGYGAVHFLVRLGREFTGPRYDDLKDLVCEIQTRTVLQDAWAIIDDHLVYKNESGIPTFLRRRLNQLAMSFERADNEFKNIRAERQDYLNSIERSQTNSESFLENELNLDSFVRYAQWKFPDRNAGTDVVDVPFFLRPLTQMGLRTLSDLDRVVDEGMPMFEEFVAANGNSFLTLYSTTSAALAALMVRQEFLPEHIKQIFPRYAEFLLERSVIG
jgi:putative GTP pyrophosphokinase